MDSEKTTTLGCIEQCKESHRCCHGPLAPLEMGDYNLFAKVKEPLQGTRYNELIRAIGRSIRNINKDGSRPW